MLIMLYRNTGYRNGMAEIERNIPMRAEKKEKPYETITAFLIIVLSIWMTIAMISEIKRNLNRDDDRNAQYYDSAVISMTAEDGTRYTFDVDVYEISPEEETPILTYRLSDANR